MIDTSVIYDRAAFGFVIEKAAGLDTILIRLPVAITPAVRIEGKESIRALQTCLLNYLANETGEWGETSQTELDAAKAEATLLTKQLESLNSQAAARIESLTTDYEKESDSLRKALDEEREKSKLLAYDKSNLKKELDTANGRRETAERQLARAQGYIDRITEGEPPAQSVTESGFESVGEISHGFHRTNRRGPNLGAEASSVNVSYR